MGLLLSERKANSKGSSMKHDKKHEPLAWKILGAWLTVDDIETEI